MRIISGIAKGRKLATFSGAAIRPTADRVREALFSILQSRIGNFNGRQVLDLYAGTGALGIEALSRGAEHCVFVDQAKPSLELVRRNVEHVGLSAVSRIIAGRVETHIPQLAAESFDLIFVDPPYADPAIVTVLGQIAECRLLRADGLLCLETSASCTLPETIGRLRRCDQRTYGTTMISLYAGCDEKEIQP